MKTPASIKQHDLSDCGAACLASIAAWYGLKYPLSRIRQYASTDQKGTNVLGILEAANKLGLLAKGVKGDSENLTHIPLPAIAHLKLESGFLHFVMIYHITDKFVRIMDPADGKTHKIPASQFTKRWTGVLILFSPMAHFEKGNKKTSLVRRFYQLLRPQLDLFIQSLVGAAVISILGLAMSVYVRFLIDDILPAHNVNLLNLIGLIMIAILVFRILLSAMKNIYLLKAGQYMDGCLILGYYRHILHLPRQFFDSMRTGELISRINDAGKIRFFISNTAVDLIVNTFIILASSIFILIISRPAALIILLTIPAFLLIYHFFNRVNKKELRSVMERSADLESHLVESLSGINTIKQLGIEEFASDKTEAHLVELLKTTYKTGINANVASNMSGLITGLITLLLLWIGGMYVMRLELTPGELMSLFTIFGYLLNPVSSLIMMNRTIQDALIAADRLFQILDLEQETSKNKIVPVRNDFRKSIVFRDIHFRYGSRNDIFSKLNLEIKPGEITGIVGESGCGKSTLISLILNHYPVQSGKIFIGKLAVENIRQDTLKKAIGVVPQHIHIFSGDFIENIAPGIPNPDVKRVIDLCESTGLLQLINTLPDGLSTYLGEKGIKLSGGEMQKLAMVRALYREPDILILDEATASLDSNAEVFIRSLITEMKKKGMTIIMIAHRLISVLCADRIICIHKGEVAEAGTHEELIRKQGFYYSLWSNQVPEKIMLPDKDSSYRYAG